MRAPRILIVDDEPGTRLDIREMLSGGECEIFEASSTDEAKVFVARVSLDIILLDLDLPDQTSIRFLEEIHLQPESRYEVIATTSSGTVRDRKLCYDRGVSHILRKPLDETDLHHIIRNSCNARRYVQHLQEFAQSHAQELERDNVQLKDQNQELEASLEKLHNRSHLLASVSHDFRAPLNVMLGFSSLLAESQLSPEQSTWLDNIRQSGTVLHELTDDVLDIQRMQYDQLKLTPQKLDLHETLTRLITQLRVLADERGLDLQLVYDEEAPRLVIADEKRIFRVVQNLITNAIKFTPAGSILLAVQGRRVRNSAHLVISVKDTGPGIPSHQQETIFQRFEQLPETSGNNAAGTGLGLAICKELVDLMGGRIAVESENGQGSRFWFKLKLPVAPLIEGPKAINSSQATRDYAKPRVLVADDDSLSQKLVKQMLHNLGFAVDIANNGQDAFDKTRNQNYDAILMDCDMPLMNGFEATRHIRDWENLSNQGPTPIIAVTGLTGDSEKDQLKEVGATAHIAKPFGFSTLEATLRKYVQPVVN